MSAIINPTPQPAPSQPPHPVAPAPPEETSGGKWKSWLILGLVAAGAGAAYEFGYKPMQEKKALSAAVVIPTATATRGALSQVIRVTGITAARDFANVTAPMIRGPEGDRPMVLLKLAESGAKVRRGDLLAQIDGQALKDHIDDVNDTVEAAQADVRKRKAELEIDWKTLEQTIQVAKADFEKARLDASAAEVRTEVERQLLQLSLEEAQARYKQVQADIANTKQQQAADLRILELTLERHRRHLSRHQNDYKRFEIRAPMDGLVVFSSIWGGAGMRQVEVGDQVRPGQGFMKVVNPASMMIDAKINQSESEAFRLGQAATMRLDAFPGMTMTGKVFSLGAIATGGWRQNAYIRTIPIKVAFEGADPRLIPDLSASAEVAVKKIDDAVLVPLQAVRQDAEGKSSVEVSEGGRWVSHPVKVALTNNTHAAIASGLDAGQRVRLF